MEREEAISWLTNEKWKNANNQYKKEWNEAFDMAIEALSVANLKEEFESAVPNCKKCAIKQLWEATEKEDLVAVVRCMDCIHYESDGGALMVCRIDDMVVDDTDYCSHGERRK